MSPTLRDTMTPLRCAAGLFAALAAGAYFAPASHPLAAQAPAPPNRIVGAMSCAAAACHGNDGAKGAAGSESHTFAEYDPHRRAFAVLFQERSERMVRLLGTDTPAHRTDLCLRCHGAAPPGLDPPPAGSDLHRSASCENCHGAAGDWLTTHYTRDWKSLPPSEKERHGFVPTKDLTIRVKLCAGCHVGEPGREVDHKLIAAGHPALRFEFAAFQAEPVYAKHWRERNDEARTWAVGQVGSARAAAELLRHRAAQPNRDWPELAEYTCFACHQGLTGSPTSGPRANRPSPGLLPWGSWQYPMLVAMADGSLGEWCRPAEKPAGVAVLVELFQGTDRPPRRDAEREAARAVGDLDRWLAELSAPRPLRPDDVRSSLRGAVRFAGDVPQTNAPATDWDRYTQGFLATAALYRSACAADPAARDAKAEADLRAVAAGLRFPDANADAPRKWTAAEGDEFRRRWRALADRFAPRGQP